MITNEITITLPTTPTSTDIVISNYSLKSLEVSRQSRSDLTKPSFGIKSNSGKLEFIDTYHIYETYINDRVLIEGCPIKINTVNSFTNNTELYGNYISGKWNYEPYQKIMSVEINDTLQDWQDINVKMSLDDDMTALDLYDYLVSITPNRYSFMALDEDTETILTNTQITYPYLEEGSLWSQWTKLCELCSLYLFNDKNGIRVLYSEGV